MKQEYEKQIRELVATRRRNNSPEVIEQISKKYLSFLNCKWKHIINIRVIRNIYIN